MEDPISLGKTDIRISPIGLGTWQWGDRAMWSYGATRTGGNIYPGNGWYNSGSPAQVSAVANSGYALYSFSGALSGGTTPQMLTMNAPKSVGAEFTAIVGTQVTVTPTLINVAPGGGQQFTATVTGLSNRTVTWSVPSGTGTGTMTGAGLYTAPSNAAPGTNVKVQAQAVDGTSQAVLSSLSNAATTTFTVATSPLGLTVYVDGVPCTTSLSRPSCPYQWTSAAGHMLAAPAVQPPSGTQYLFSYWSDGWPMAHAIPSGTSATTFTAYYNPRGK